MTDLERVYKSRLDESHAAGLVAVFEAGKTAGRLETTTTPEGPASDRQEEARDEERPRPEEDQAAQADGVETG